MDQSYRDVYELLPVSVFKAAHAGDSIAMDKVLRHYEPYISKLCTRKLYDEYGGAHHCLDEYMKRHLEIKLITAILTYRKSFRKKEPGMPIGRRFII